MIESDTANTNKCPFCCNRQSVIERLEEIMREEIACTLELMEAAGVVEQVKAGRPVQVVLLNAIRKMRAGLEGIIKDEPCIDPNGRIFCVHCDENGENVGDQDIDPCGLIRAMVDRARRSLP